MQLRREAFAAAENFQREECVTIRRKDRSRGIKHETDKYEKLAVAAIFCAVAVAGSLFSFPVFGSKCPPVQHMVNILCAVLFRTGYGLGAAFAAALIRIFWDLEA